MWFMLGVIALGRGYELWRDYGRGVVLERGFIGGFFFVPLHSRIYIQGRRRDELPGALRQFGGAD